MASPENRMSLTRPKTITANFACFAAMVIWAIGFPAAEILLQSWGVISLVWARQLPAVLVLLIAWIVIDGWRQVCMAPWWRGFGVGGIGFGLGGLLLLAGQKLSDPVTPAIAAAMMPIAGAVIEVVMDNRRLRLRLVVGITLALIGGIVATGVRLTEGSFGLGAMLCLSAVVLFAWATRVTTGNFPDLSAIGQTTITLAGSLVFMLLVHVAALAGDFQGTEIGLMDSHHISLLLLVALASIALAQLLWIWGAGGLGILLASLHMNAVPFYVMVVVVIWLGEQWNWVQAIGAAVVCTGVLIAQTVRREKS